MTPLRNQAANRNLQIWLTILVALFLALILGYNADSNWPIILAVGLGVFLLAVKPFLGLLLIPIVALLAQSPVSTGTAVTLNFVVLLVPAVLVIWALSAINRGQLHLVQSRTTLPLFLFLVAGLLSLVIGNVTWDPFVPKNANFLLVQLAQWIIFAFSAGAFWLTANMIKEAEQLNRLTGIFLAVGGILAILFVVPATRGLVGSLTTVAIIRPPFWILLAGLAGGQLLFNPRLKPLLKVSLILILLATVWYAFINERESASNWVGIAAVFGVLYWFRFSRTRLILLVFLAATLFLGILFPAVWEFAGGEAEWNLSGVSRIGLINHVIKVSMYNPITGLGPASYRAYANNQPLIYGDNRVWLGARISSHNNYVDLFSQVGVLGSILFFWFVFELGRIALRLRQRYERGFEAGYVNAMLAVGIGSLVIMVLADWILPFVYNIGFPGFQASILVWLFMGGLIALEQIALTNDAKKEGLEREQISKNGKPI